MPRPLRCAFRVDGRRCTRNGTGNPPLCNRCRDSMAVGPNPIAAAKSAITDVISRFVTGKRITERDVQGAMSEVAAMLGGTPLGDAVRQGASGGLLPWMKPPAPPRPQPPRQPDPVIARNKEIARCRKVLGIDGMFLHLDRAELDKIRRQLARKYHPDRKGGSTAKMQEINHAVDFLLTTVDN